MQSVGKILTKFNPQTDKFISREFQSFGVHLSEELDDYKHKSLYIKLAKTIHRSLLEKALSFAVDSNAKNKGALFMWKLTQLKKEAKTGSVIASPSAALRVNSAKRSRREDSAAPSANWRSPRNHNEKQKSV